LLGAQIKVVLIDGDELFGFMLRLFASVAFLAPAK